MTLDVLIDQTNDDLKDCLAPVRDRFRFALSTIFDYAVANPTQGNASTAQSAINSTFSGTYADGLVSPGISVDTFTQAFLTRHGVGANANQRWVSVRDFLVAREQLKGRVVGAYEEGTLPPLAEMWLDTIRGNSKLGIAQVADFSFSELREETPGPTFNFVTERRWSSASLGKTVRQVVTNTFDGVRVNKVESPVEIV